jgi:hypothetical protein
VKPLRSNEDIKSRKGLRIIVPNYLPLGFIGLASVAMFYYLPGTYYFLIPLYIGLTFYLFCNIIRVGNFQELIWYSVFIAITVLFLHDPRLYITLVLGVCVPIQAGIILWRLRKRRAGERKADPVDRDILP